MTATDQPTSTITDADKTAVSELIQRIVAAWADHDADAFAKVFTEDGTMILPGVFCKGHEQIKAFMADAFAGPYQGTRVTGQPFDVRFLGPEVGLLLTQGGVLAPGETELREDRMIRAAWLAQKQDGQWRLAAYQNSPR